MFLEILSYFHRRLPPHTDLHCPIITARTDELRPSPCWIAGVHKRGVALQPLHSLSSLTVPHSHSLVCRCWEEHAVEKNQCETLNVRSISPTHFLTLQTWGRSLKYKVGATESDTHFGWKDHVLLPEKMRLTSFLLQPSFLLQLLRETELFCLEEKGLLSTTVQILSHRTPLQPLSLSLYHCTVVTQVQHWALLNVMWLDSDHQLSLHRSICKIAAQHGVTC